MVCKAEAAWPAALSALAARAAVSLQALDGRLKLRLHALSFYTHAGGAGCAWRNKMLLLTLKGDWALGRDPIMSVTLMLCLRSLLQAYQCSGAVFSMCVARGA